MAAAAAKVAYDMGLECRDIVVERIKKYSIDCDLKFGYLDLALSDRDLRDFEASVETKQKAGYPHEVELVPKTSSDSTSAQSAISAGWSTGATVICIR